MDMPSNRKGSAKPAILVVNSQVIRGSVGGRASVHVFECLGYPVWFLPTVLLPWHPGQGKSTKVVSSQEKFSILVRELADSGKLKEIGGILTGYFVNPMQIEEIIPLINSVREANPNVKYLCDPIIGDGSGETGNLYVNTKVAEGIRDKLLPLADIATPNLFELSWLSGLNFAPSMNCKEACKRLNKDRIVVTSVPAESGNMIANRLIVGGSEYSVKHEKYERVPHGTGDLLAALTLAGVVEEATAETLLSEVTSNVLDVIRFSVAEQSDELVLSQLTGDRCVGVSDNGK